MHRYTILLSNLLIANPREKVLHKLLNSSSKGPSLSFLFKAASQQYTRCLCGYHGNTSVHRKTVHQTHNLQAQALTDQRWRGNKRESSKFLAVIAGTGLLSYCVWKKRHSIKELDNPFVVLAHTEQSNTDSTTDDDKDIPSYVPYLLIGGGTASHSASRAIRLRDHKAQVLIVGAEHENPYSRPPLSKELWYGEKTALFYDPDAYFIPPEDLTSMKYGGVSVLKGRKVVKLDTVNKIAYLNGGKEIKYDKCLIATGGRPKNLPIFQQAEKQIRNRIHLFRTVNDFLFVHRVVHACDSIAVIGGGFLGSELACAFGYKGDDTSTKVYHIFPEKGVMSKILPEYLSKYATEKVRQEGVEVLSEKSVKSVSYEDHQVVLTLNDGSQVKVDDVVVAVGLKPNDEIAKRSDLDIDPDRGGVMANAELEAKPDIWVAGDVASFYDYKYGRARAEHQSVADNMGKIAGQNMTGAKKLYEHQPYFWSDLGPHISYQAIGEVDSDLETNSVFMKVSRKYNDHENPKDDKNNSSESTDFVTPQSAEALDKSEFYQGVVFYYKDGLIVGMVLWNVFGRGKIHAAKQIIERNKEVKNEDFYELSKLLFRNYKYVESS